MQVNGQSITEVDYQHQVDEVRMLFEQYRALLQQQYGPYASQMMAQYGLTGNPEDRAVPMLIQKAILDGLANDLRIVIPDSKVRDETMSQLRQIPGLLHEDGHVDSEMLKQITGYKSLNALEQKMQKNMTITDSC